MDVSAYLLSAIEDALTKLRDGRDVEAALILDQAIQAIRPHRYLRASKRITDALDMILTAEHLDHPKAE